MDKWLLSQLQQGEGLGTEFKRCGSLPEKDTFETICSFANRQGGHIFLGVNDDGTISGVPETLAKEIERNIVNITSNPNMFNTAPSLEFTQIACDEKLVIDVWVPMGPSVYRFKGAVYDRVADVDIKLKGDDQLSALYLRKQNIYTEQRVYPYVTMGDLDMTVMAKAKQMIRANRPDHPWLSLSDDEFLRVARLRTKDFQTGVEGINLAGVMLLGKDDTIRGVCPAYRTDAILRNQDSNRYVDRQVVATNLIDSYYELVGFCKRWLPDKFTLNGDQRVSVRDIIVRELVSNTLIHREYSSPYISQLVISPRGLETKNASRCLFSGAVTPNGFSPTPKNPIIADFFVQIGLAEELGSGTRKLYECSKLYTGTEPLLCDGDFFEAFVAVPQVAYAEAVPSGSEGVRGGGEGVREELSYENKNVLAPLVDKNTHVKTKAQAFEECIFDLLTKQKSITSGDVAKACGISQRGARRHLSSMVNAGTLKAERQGRAITYSRNSQDS